MHPGVTVRKCLVGEATEVSNVFKRFEQLYDEEPEFNSGDIFKIKRVKPFGGAVTHTLFGWFAIRISISSLSLVIHHYM